MMKATWCLCLLAVALVAAADGRAQDHEPKKRPSYSVSSGAKGRDAPSSPADVPRSGRSRVPRRAEARARRGVEDDPVPVEDLGNMKSAREAASRAIEELEALKEHPVEGALDSHLKEMKSRLTSKAAVGETPQTPAAEEEQKGDGEEEQVGNRSVPYEAQQANSRFSLPQIAPGDNSTPEAVPGNRFSPQPPPTEQSSSEAGRNGLKPKANADRFTPNAGIDSQVAGEGNKRDPSASVKSKYDVSERGNKRVSSAAGHRNKYSTASKSFANEEGNRNRFSAERNRFTPDERDRGRSAPTDNQSTTTKSVTPEAASNVTSAWGTGVTPDKEGSLTSGEVGGAAGSGGSAGRVGTEPQWLAWYNTRPWRQETLSDYGEQARPSRKPYGL